MKRKERAIEFVRDCFGVATATFINGLEEEECVEFARDKVQGVYGDAKVQEFDNFLTLNFKEIF